MPDLRVFRRPSFLGRAVAEAFVDAVRRRAPSEEGFSVALSGGATPRGLYEALGTDFALEIPWSRVHFFWVDERYVPPDHPDSNYRMAREVLLDRVDAPAGNIHAPATDLDEPDEAAARYEETLRHFFGSGEPRLDWVLLGLGGDGHVASLFPGHAALSEAVRWVVAVKDTPKPPPVRLTMTLPLINFSSEVHFLVAGVGKAEALRSVLQGPFDPLRFPAQGVRPDRGKVTWWVDEEAARGLMRSS